MRIGRHHDVTANVGISQGGVPRLIEREVDQTIVDEIDRSTVHAQPAADESKLTGIGDHRLHAVLLHQGLGKLELRIEMLLFGRIVDDGDEGSPDPVAARLSSVDMVVTPSANVAAGFGSDPRLLRSTAGALRASQRGVKESAAGVRAVSYLAES
jgi:hypothetical protein